MALLSTPTRTRSRDDYARTMRRMFAAVSTLYDRYWSDYFHFAWYERPDEDWETALGRTHRHYLDLIEAKDARRILELACGRGGFTELLARETGGEVLGVDISEAQLARARKRRAPNLRFEQHDVMHVDELDGRFDAAVYLDAACYLPDKARALKRIAKVLEPGARLLLVDWCRAEKVNVLQDELILQPFMRAWAVPSLETASSYRHHLRDAGFRVLQVEDLNDRVQPNWERGYWSALEAVAKLGPAELPRLAYAGLKLGPEGIRLMKDQFAAALYIKAGFDAGVLRYVLVLAERAGVSGSARRPPARRGPPRRGPGRAPRR